jgi:CHAT domain-containing protein
MTARRYENLDVRLDPSATRSPAGYVATVTASPVGAHGPVPFLVPFSDERLELLLMHLEPWRVRTRRVADAPTRAAQELGGALYTALFHDALGDALAASLRAAPDGLRIRIDLTRTPALAGLPWELLYDRESHRHLALSERTPVVRHLQVANPPKALPVAGPLRVLAILSSPPGLDPLDIDTEWRVLQTELAALVDGGRLLLDRLHRPTLAALHRYLRVHDVHVVHVVGHGDFDVRQQDGVLYLEDELGMPRPVSSAQLGPHLHDHDPLRLVVLNACQTASSDRTDAFSGLAQGLVQQGVPAVVAMQVPISDGGAICFSRDFYTAIAATQPVDQALTGARKALWSDFGYEWATPVLFLRLDDGILFREPVQESLHDPPPSESKPPPTTPTTRAKTTGPAKRAERAARATTPKPRNTTVSPTKSTGKSVRTGATATGKQSVAPPGPNAAPRATPAVAASTAAGTPASRTVRNPRTGERSVVATPPVDAEAWRKDLLIRVRVVTARSSATRTWGKVVPLVEALPAGATMLMNRLRHSEDTFVQVTRVASGYDLEYRYAGRGRHYRSHVATADEANRVLHAWLNPPRDPAGRHTALVLWTPVKPGDAAAPEVEALRADLDDAVNRSKGTALGTLSVAYTVRASPAVAGDRPTTRRWDVTLGTAANQLSVEGQQVSVGGAVIVLHKRDWTPIDLKAELPGRGSGVVQAQVRAAGWFGRPALRLGATSVTLGDERSAGTVRVVVRPDASPSAQP